MNNGSYSDILAIDPVLYVFRKLARSYE